MYAIVVAQVTLQPLDPEAIGGVTPLPEDISPAADEVCRIEDGLVLGEDVVEGRLGVRRRPLVVLVVEFVVKLWLGRSCPSGTEPKVLFKQPAVGPGLELAPSIGHRSLDDLVADHQEWVAWVCR